MKAKQEVKTQTRSEGRSFSSKVELFTLGLKSCECALDRNAYAKMRRAGPENALRLIASRTFIDAVLDETDAFDGGIKYELAVKERGEKVSALTIECVFLAHFHGPSKPKKEKIEFFLKTYMPIISWPYFRQFVSDTTARMAIAPITLPLIGQDQGGNELD